MNKKINKLRSFWLPIFGVFILLSVLGSSFYNIYQKQQLIQEQNNTLNSQINSDQETIQNIKSEIDKLNNEDLRKTNIAVNQEIEQLKTSYKSTLVQYEEILKLRDLGQKTSALETKLATILNHLSKDELDLANKAINVLSSDINKEKAKLVSAVTAPISANVPEIKDTPSSGYRRQKVTVDDGSYLVDIISADLSSTKVIVDTASDGTCTNDCPVLSLSTYALRSGAYAGINGSYFCPETYPSCSEKKNSFDTLLMNKNKIYFNSDNNVYSSVPVVIFSGNSARFIGQSSGWGRDTGVDAVIANRPLLVLDGNNMFAGVGEEKESLKSNRSFLGSSGNIAYIGVVHGATVAQSVKVLQSMGIKNAINLDSGGSTALWSGGYKVGPGRNLPNVVLFVRK